MKHSKYQLKKLYPKRLIDIKEGALYLLKNNIIDKYDNLIDSIVLGEQKIICHKTNDWFYSGNNITSDFRIIHQIRTGKNNGDYTLLFYTLNITHNRNTKIDRFQIYDDDLEYVNTLTLEKIKKADFTRKRKRALVDKNI